MARRDLAISALLILLSAAVPLTVGVQNDGLFEVFIGDWETCRRINSSATCYRTRDVHCMSAGDGAPTPWRYCTQRGKGRLATVEECECEQDCVVTMWSEWTPCSEGQVYKTRQRTVVAPALRNGKPCPALYEKRRCEKNPATIAQLNRSHTWRVGQWRECVPIDSTRDCGEGLRRRSVDCVDAQGSIVDQTFCLEEEAYLRVLPPQTAQLCQVPCPCILSPWEGWTDCFTNCSLPSPQLVRQRTRTIMHYPTRPGQLCEAALEQTEICPGVAQCPVYSWDTSGWSDCSVQDETAACGVGVRRRYAYCISDSMEHVSSDKCNSTLQPSLLASCEVPCTQHCTVTPWSNWELCRNDTCNITYTRRNRSVILPASGQGALCPHLTEHKECPRVPCVQWAADEWLENCFPQDHAVCGEGTQSRGVRCQDPEGNKIDNDLCDTELLPVLVQDCYKHCFNDCVISYWEQWSECSETCNNVEGVQSRSRYLLTNGSGSCVHINNNATFYEERVCSVDIPCVPELYYIVYSGWEECRLPTGAVVDGRVCEGIQSRSAVCHKDEQVLTQSECPIHFEALEERACSMPCTSECLSEWSEYSECSDTCLKTRTRRLLQYGENCPDVDSSGVETETVTCALPCNSAYHWVTQENWSQCYVFPTPLSQLSPGTVNPSIPDPGVYCGQGYRNRSVQCEDASGETVPEGRCPAESKPAAFEACLFPCDRRCIITDWTDYSICNATNPMERTRRVEPFRGSSDYLIDCPELETVVQMDIETCPVHDFSFFQWLAPFEFGELHDCQLDPTETCGSGELYKTYGCVDNRHSSSSERNAVSPEFCDQGLLSGFEKVQICTDPCNIDCQYSEAGWSSWSPCSVSCGQGQRTRTRIIVRVPQDEGRQCGHLNETTTCEMPTCDYFKYVFSPFSVCRLLNQSETCGQGERVSYPMCLVNGVVQSNITACSSLGPRGPKTRECHVPCDGECVLSDWTEWVRFPAVLSSCYERTRKILREGSGDCEPGNLREVRPCSSSSEFVWQEREWTDCILDWMPRSVRDYCGSGVQKRIVECVRQSTGETTYEARCQHLPKPVGAKGCSIPCPVDCEVSSFVAWSGCEECSLDLKATMSRERHVLLPPENGGRECPHLREQRACPTTGCDEYFFETNSSALDCFSEQSDQVCGSFPHTVLLCRKNSQYVPLEECVRANASRRIVHDAHLLNSPETYCNIECPMLPVCHANKWGEWSECLRMCDWPLVERDETQSPWFQFRSRTLLNSDDSRECHDAQQDVRMCSPANASSNITESGPQCISFDWFVSEWRTDNSREVWCHGNDTVVEDTACIQLLEPVAKQNSEGVGLCNCPSLSTCNEITTACTCELSFEKIGSFCLSIEGCVLLPDIPDTQCALPGEECSNDGKCMCTADSCQQTPSSTNPTVSESTETTPTPTSMKLPGDTPTSDPSEDTTTSAGTSGEFIVVLADAATVSAAAAASLCSPRLLACSHPHPGLCGHVYLCAFLHVITGSDSSQTNNRVITHCLLGFQCAKVLNIRCAQIVISVSLILPVDGWVTAVHTLCVWGCQVLFI